MDDLKNRFEYHPPKSKLQEAKYEQVRTACLMAARHIFDLTPAGREQSLAITKLEEAMFWANAAIARTNG